MDKIGGGMDKNKLMMGLSEFEINTITAEQIPDKIIDHYIFLKKMDMVGIDLDDLIVTYKNIGDKVLEWNDRFIFLYSKFCVGLPAHTIFYCTKGITNVQGAYKVNLKIDDIEIIKFKEAGEIPAFYNMSIKLPKIIKNTIDCMAIKNNEDKITLNKEFGNWAPLIAIISPAKILERYADKKEAHRFFIETKDIDISNEERSIWEIYLEWAGMKELIPVSLNDKIFQWAKRHWNSADMIRIRRSYGPVGSVREYTYREIIEELQEEDIESINDSVERVFNRRAKRIKNEQEEQENYEFPKEQYKGNEYIIYINDYRTLIEIGKFMQNCARDYADAIREGKTALYQVHDDNNNTATIEVANGKIYQIYGPKNTPPADTIRHIVKNWCEQNNIEYNK